MDPTELINTVVEPVTGAISRIFGPAADEVAEMWKDQVRLYRFGNQLKCVKKAERMCQDAGYTPQAVPAKILFPLLEGASFEDDENLEDMWAALLANAALPENAGKVRPGFIAVLKQMAPDEAALLNWIFSQRTGVAARPFNDPISYVDLVAAYTSLGIQAKEDHLGFDACIQSLQAEQLVEPRLDVGTPLGPLRPSYSLTFRGLSFMYACLSPAPKSQ